MKRITWLWFDSGKSERGIWLRRRRNGGAGFCSERLRAACFRFGPWEG